MDAIATTARSRAAHDSRSAQLPVGAEGPGRGERVHVGMQSDAVNWRISASSTSDGINGVVMNPRDRRDLPVAPVALRQQRHDDATPATLKVAQVPTLPATGRPAAVDPHVVAQNGLADGGCGRAG